MTIAELLYGSEAYAVIVYSPIFKMACHDNSISVTMSAVGELLIESFTCDWALHLQRNGRNVVAETRHEY